MCIRDLGYADSESMLVKAQLATKIAEIVQTARAHPDPRAEFLGLTQPKVSALLKGGLRDFGTPFVGMPDPVGPGCPHCDQADAQEPVERPADAFRGIGSPEKHRGRTRSLLPWGALPPKPPGI